MRCWLIGIILSIGSSSASLVKLRADGRRFALTQAAARKENAEKSPEEKVRAEEERREKGRALLAWVYSRTWKTVGYVLMNVVKGQPSWVNS
jgi:hypothetical protein